MDPIPQSPAHSEQSDNETKQMYTENIVYNKDSLYTLEFKRQTPAQTKFIYSAKFDPDENRYLALGIFGMLLLFSYRLF
jgi:hypothetical protein